MMSFTRNIVILANSYKKNGSCVAGKDIDTKEWIRPVADSDGAALNSDQTKMTNSIWDGTYALKTLQKAKIKFIKKVPLSSQPENYLIDASSTWSHHYNLKRESLSAYEDHPEHIWSYGYVKDRVSVDILNEKIDENHHSLYLIHVDTITMRVERNYNGYNKLVGIFTYNGKEYEFNVTDPLYCKYKKRETGYTFEESDKFLCLSLTDAFYGDHYKLIASIL